MFFVQYQRSFHRKCAKQYNETCSNFLTQDYNKKNWNEIFPALNYVWLSKKYSKKKRSCFMDIFIK